MELTLEDLAKHVEKYYEVNGKYPNNIRISRRMSNLEELQEYCTTKKIKISFIEKRPISSQPDLTPSQQAELKNYITNLWKSINND